MKVLNPEASQALCHDGAPLVAELQTTTTITTPPALPSKIAFLPDTIRQKVNLRLQQGDDEKRICQWLSRLPAARAAWRAKALPPSIQAPELLQWKEGGYKDWKARQFATMEVQRMADAANELRSSVKGPMAEDLAAWITARYAMATRLMVSENGNGEMDWNLLREFCHDVVVLRRGDHSAEWVRIERERLDMERKQQERDLDQLFVKWAKEHPEKLYHKKALTPRERQRRMAQAFGIMPEVLFERQAEARRKERETKAQKIKATNSNENQVTPKT
jgi:hypothetical protein